MLERSIVINQLGIKIEEYQKQLEQKPPLISELLKEEINLNTNYKIKFENEMNEFSKQVLPYFEKDEDIE